MTAHIRLHSRGTSIAIAPLLPPLVSLSLAPVLPTPAPPLARTCPYHRCVFVVAASPIVCSLPSPSHLDFTHKRCAEGDSSTRSSGWHMEYFVLVVLAPLTVVCLCCVIMFYYRRSSRLPSPAPSLPTSSYSIAPDNPQGPVSQSPLISSHRFSAQHQQERLRKQREIVCPRSESTEKFPTSVCLLDEDEPPHMRDSVRIHREVMSENGIRAPPNRTVYDSERQDLMIQCRGKTENLQRHPVRRSPSATSSTSSKRAGSVRGGGGGSGGGGGGGGKHGATISTTLQGAALIDSETRSPLNLVDSDSEGPPPYASLVQTNNNITNVCDASSSVSTRISSSSNADAAPQSPHQPPPPPRSPACQPNSNGRFQGSARGASRGSSVRLKGADCV